MGWALLLVAVCAAFLFWPRNPVPPIGVVITPIAVEPPSVEPKLTGETLAGITQAARARNATNPDPLILAEIERIDSGMRIVADRGESTFATFCPPEIVGTLAAEYRRRGFKVRVSSGDLLVLEWGE